MDEGRRFRVEHRAHGQTRVVGEVAGVAAHHQSLALFAARLVGEGATGTVVLVDAASGQAVARRRLPTRGQARPDRLRPPTPSGSVAKRAVIAERVAVEARRQYAGQAEASVLEQWAREAVADLWAEGVRVAAFLPPLALRAVGARLAAGRQATGPGEVGRRAGR
jgi:hypothetical protein